LVQEIPGQCSLLSSAMAPKRGLAVFNQLLDECGIPHGPTGSLLDVFIEMVSWDGQSIMGLRIGMLRTSWTADEVQHQLTYMFPRTQYRVRSHFRRLDEISELTSVETSSPSGEHDSPANVWSSGAPAASRSSGAPASAAAPATSWSAAARGAPY
jgi:hypothetical protein